jgi:hypothetical protein
MIAIKFLVGLNHKTLLLYFVRLIYMDQLDMIKIL